MTPPSDFVIVGSGGAGLTAAIAAATTFGYIAATHAAAAYRG